MVKKRKHKVSLVLALSLALGLAACGGTSASSAPARWLDQELIVEDDLSGSGDVIGQYAYVKVTAEQLKSITSEELTEFAEKHVVDTDYNRVGILADDGTGLCFTGDILNHGTIDQECMVTDVLHTYFRGSDGTYSESMTDGELDAIGDIEVEKELFDVSITLPADLVGEDTTQEDLNAAVEEGTFHSAVLNEDGSATYVMSKRQHKKLMEETAASVNQSLDEMIGSEEYPSFVDITANENFTEFTVTTTSTELTMPESFSTLVFYMYGGMYNIFAGETVDNVHVDFVNAETGEVISSSNSADMGE